MGKVSDITPAEDIIKGYLLKPSTFMPNGMDLDDITEWRKTKSTQPATGDQSTDIPTSNIFLEEPQNMCEARESLGVQDNSISISLKQPHNQ